MSVKDTNNEYYIVLAMRKVREALELVSKLDMIGKENVTDILNDAHDTLEWMGE